MSVIPDVNVQKALGYEVFNLTIICPKVLMLLKQIQSLGGLKLHKHTLDFVILILHLAIMSKSKVSGGRRISCLQSKN